MSKFAIPLAVFVLMVGLLGYGLRLDPKKVPSPLIDKQAPSFSLTMLEDQSRTLSTADMLGQVWVLNVWASWCISCRAEHEVITELANMKLVNIVGLDYKDEPEEGKRWLQHFGDPYTLSVVDYDGRVGIDWGVYGAPETFLVDEQGIIRHKVIGPLSDQDKFNALMEVVRELQGT